MSVFLILPASWIVFPFSHSVERLELAMAEPHPKVLNFASTIVPFSTLICSFMTSPHSGAPTIPVPTPASSFLKLPMLRGLLKWSTTLSLYAMFRPSSNLNRGSEKVSRWWIGSGSCRSDHRQRCVAHARGELVSTVFGGLVVRPSDALLSALLAAIATVN